MRRLRVLSEHPHVGRPNDLLEEFEGAQAYVDIGVAEWVEEARSAPVETTEAAGPAETALARPPVRRSASPSRGARRTD